MRLWRKHGIAWGVRAEAEASPTDPPRHTLVLVDDSAQLPANPAGRLRCHTGTAVREHDDITLWSPVGRVVPSLVERAAWSYTQQQPLRQPARYQGDSDQQGQGGQGLQGRVPVRQRKRMEKPLGKQQKLLRD